MHCYVQCWFSTSGYSAFILEKYEQVSECQYVVKTYQWQHEIHKKLLPSEDINKHSTKNKAEKWRFRPAANQFRRWNMLFSSAAYCSFTSLISSKEFLPTIDIFAFVLYKFASVVITSSSNKLTLQLKLTSRTGTLLKRVRWNYLAIYITALTSLSSLQLIIYLSAQGPMKKLTGK